MAVTEPTTPDLEPTLRAVVEPLAQLVRKAGSEDERRAAEMIAEALARAGARVTVDEETFLDGYARLLLPLGAAGLLAALSAAGGRRRPLAALVAAAAAAALIDDVENGRRPYRKALARPKPTQNVIGECGDPDAERTLVVLAHHDAAPTGAAFDPSLQRWLAEHHPEWVQRTDTALPIWWPTAAGPILAALAAATGSRRLARLGAGLCAFSLGVGIDIARDRIVPGANDNLSGVAALVGLAERLSAEPIEGIRVVLASCGAEEVLQGGIYGFVERRLRPLDPERTWVLNLDSIGSPELIMVEGEGPFFMHDYCDPAFRDLLADVTQRATGAPLRRGTRARASTDSIVPSRAGYPTATFVSWEPDTKLTSNYHLPSDVPEHLRYDTIARAVAITDALARELAVAGR